MKLLSKYTLQEVEHFERMHRELTEYNTQVAKNPSKIKRAPLFSPDEMEKYSRYRELVLEAAIEDDD